MPEETVLATGLLIDRLRRIEKRVSKIEARYRDMKGDVADLMEEHVIDDDTGHYYCHDDAADALDTPEGTYEESDDSEDDSTSEEGEESSD